MEPERWQQVKRVLDDSRGKTREELPAWLDEACGGDVELRGEVESLLGYDDRLDDFAAAAPLDRLLAAEDRAVGQRVGPYRITGVLGRGGMGAVYRAERAEGFEQTVALKLVRAGVDSPEALERFHRERQILARLEHPHIARLLDGGTTADGRPYFAMELVEGEPIDQYCDRESLSTRQRLELLLPVCDALAYAHRNLVIHRDLKPANILIGKDGAAKLLDFGIAKLIAPEGAPAELTAHVMTPRWASPEQLLDRPITTASDVYSLAVVLHQLLTGRLPCGLDTCTAGFIPHAVCSDEPRPPSTTAGKTEEVGRGDEARVLTPESVAALRGVDAGTLGRELRGDLDAIALKALRKEPEQRYASVERLAEDLRRHLDGLPVRARRGTFTYRAGKYARRHRGWLAAAAAAVAMIVGFTALLVRQLEHTRDERDRAELQEQRAAREAEAANQVSDFLVGMFERSDSLRTGKNADQVSAREVLERGAERLRDTLGDQPEVRARLLTTVGSVYVNLALFREAEPLLREGLALREEVFGPDSLEVAESLQMLGRLTAMSSGPGKDLEPLFRRAVEIRERRLDPDDLNLAESLRSLGVVYIMMNRRRSARSLLERALGIRERRLGPEHADVGDVLLRLAHLEAAEGRFDDAIPLMERAAAISERHLGSDHAGLVPILGNRARFYLDGGRLDEAEPEVERVLALAEKQLGPDHQYTAESLQTLARVHMARGRWQEAEPLLARALGVYEARGGDFRVRVAALRLRAEICRELGRLAEAGDFLERALALFEERAGPNRPQVAGILEDYAPLLRAMGRESEASEAEARARAIRDKNPNAPG